MACSGVFFSVPLDYNYWTCITNVVNVFSLWQEGPRKDGCSSPGLVCDTSWEAPWGEGPHPRHKEKCERASERWVETSIKWEVNVPCCGEFGGGNDCIDKCQNLWIKQT